VINGILWRFRTGSSWRDVPDRYGPRTTLYNRFIRWRKTGVWDRLLDAVSKRYDGDIVMIDTSCVCVHQDGANAKKGDMPILAWDVRRGGLTTKIHALVDADGLPVRLELTAGRAADAPMAELKSC
jgi:transposase